MVYIGSPGIGKTYLCSALIPWIYKKVQSFRYWKERDLLEKLREGIDKGWDYNKEMKYLLDHDFVMIDDVGSSGINTWRKEVLFALIDHQYENKKPCVITSNLTRKEISEGLGERSASRLFASENTIIEVPDGKDLRQEGK